MLSKSNFTEHKSFTDLGDKMHSKFVLNSGYGYNNIDSIVL